MGLLDLFRREKAAPTETRAIAQGYTADLIAARAEWLSGRSCTAELTATVQSCVSLWESGFTLADVAGTDMLDRRTLAMLARSLALRGEALFLIRDRLLPVTDWDMKTLHGEPTAYRVSVSEVGGGHSQTVLAAEVLHVRIGSSPITPWAGTAPLHRASLSAELLQEVETALRDVYRDGPIGSQIVPLPEGSTEDMAAMRAQLRGRRGSSLVIEGVAQATAAGMNPQLGQRPESLTPDLQRAMTTETLAAARGAILMAYGVLPALLNPATTGPLVREAQRHLAQLVLQPMALIVAEEATAKLGQPVTIDCVRPMQAFDHGGKARAFATMLGALAEAKAAGLDMQTIKDAEAFIDWAD
ncbi:phage portal protein [uncultured Sphingomonas sp.]|uniref:phage portal protein n=1 Tax=uncultured Sphingomonas sp. TaxID=158754 RepID=UPI0025E417C9|nr:phage portal protein [uncultured Sphingomonas sp.]